nr:hypothetical protein [Clostridia bacterium]
HSLEKLFDTYINSVGANTTFILNIPPMPSGKFDPRDVARLHELGELIRSEFADNFADEVKIERIDDASTTQVLYKLTIPENRKAKYLVLREDIEQGQRVETFVVFRQMHNGRQKLFSGTCIGNRKIVRLNNVTGEVCVHITSSRDVPQLLPFELY